MILLENDLEKFEKKVVIAGWFKYEGRLTAKLKFKVFYDNGNGEGIVAPKKLNYEFAREVTEQGYKGNEELFSLSDGVVWTENFDNDTPVLSKFDVRYEKNRRMIKCELLNFACSVKYPVFFQLDNDYLFINESNFDKSVDPDEYNSDHGMKNGEVARIKMLKDIDAFIGAHAYGKDYEKHISNIKYNEFLTKMHQEAFEERHRRGSK